jgi:hypothetical protein
MSGSGSSSSESLGSSSSSFSSSGPDSSLGSGSGSLFVDVPRVEINLNELEDCWYRYSGNILAGVMDSHQGTSIKNSTIELYKWAVTTYSEMFHPPLAVSPSEDSVPFLYNFPLGLQPPRRFCSVWMLSRRLHAVFKIGVRASFEALYSSGLVEKIDGSRFIAPENTLSRCFHGGLACVFLLTLLAFEDHALYLPYIDLGQAFSLDMQHDVDVPVVQFFTEMENQIALVVENNSYEEEEYEEEQDGEDVTAWIQLMLLRIQNIKEAFLNNSIQNARPNERAVQSRNPKRMKKARRLLH